MARRRSWRPSPPSGLPYACVPAGTRNHFALDLGVDRDDVVGALDAFVDGGERRVDLAEVNGRVFVNNVSLGLYAEAVQRSGYRDAKIRTLLDTVPDVLGPDGGEPDMRWHGPGGHEHRGGAAVLVSNNRYRLGRAVGSGTRPRIDDGLLGITVVGSPTGGGEEGSPRSARGASGPRRHSRSMRNSPVPAGIDGETVVLHAPLHFRIRAGVLQVRIARQHPGASPSAMVPEGMWAGVAELARIALGRQQTPESQHKGGRNGPDRDCREGAAQPGGRRSSPAGLADALASNNEVEFERGGMRITVHVPDEVNLKLEIEVGDEESELEIELDLVIDHHALRAEPRRRWSARVIAERRRRCPTQTPWNR